MNSLVAAIYSERNCKVILNLKVGIVISKIISYRNVLNRHFLLLASYLNIIYHAVLISSVKNSTCCEVIQSYEEGFHGI